MNVTLRHWVLVGLMGFGLAIGGVGLWVSRPALGAVDVAAAPATAPAKPNAEAAAQQRLLAQELRKGAEAAAANAANYTGELKEAAEGLVAARQKAAEAREALADAFEAEDVTQIQELGQVAIPRVSMQALRAAYKLEALQQGAEFAKAGLEQLAEARKALAEAWAKYAAIITPDAPQAQLEDAYAEVLARSDDLQTAGRGLDFARRGAYWKDLAAAYKNPDVDAKAEEVSKLMGDLMACWRQENELKVRIRKLERAVARAEVEMGEAAKKAAAAPKPEVAAPKAEEATPKAKEAAPAGD